MLAPTAAGVCAGGFWSAPRQWPGETVFLICGGPSVAAVDPELLRGRRVVVVNSSCYRFPWADLLVFGDARWGRVHAATIAAFAGLVVTTTYLRNGVQLPNVRYLWRPRPKQTPQGLSADPCEILMRHTSARAAINLLCHFGVARIITLGLDGGPDKSGATHHHEPHQWGPIAEVWQWQREELAAIVAPLRERGVELINASPGSRIPFWPIIKLESLL